jgi:hypothetical protein
MDREVHKLDTGIVADHPIVRVRGGRGVEPIPEHHKVRTGAVHRRR